MSREPEIMESQVMWEPDTKRNTHMDRFRTAVANSCGLRLANYNDLYQWSVESFSDFWAEFWKYSNIVCSHLYDEGWYSWKSASPDITNGWKGD